MLRELFGDFHAAPKSNMIFDRFGRFLRLGVVPGGVLIGSVADPDMVVTRDALPRTGGVGVLGEKYSRLIESSGK